MLISRLVYQAVIDSEPPSSRPLVYKKSFPGYLGRGIILCILCFYSQVMIIRDKCVEKQTMKISLHSLWVLVAVFALRATAACTAYGVDYANGGSYNIDASSSDYFSFQTVFQGMERL